MQKFCYIPHCYILYCTQAMEFYCGYILVVKGKLLKSAILCNNNNSHLLDNADSLNSRIFPDQMESDESHHHSSKSVAVSMMSEEDEQQQQKQGDDDDDVEMIHSVQWNGTDDGHNNCMLFQSRELKCLHACL